MQAKLRLSENGPHDDALAPILTSGERSRMEATLIAGSAPSARHRTTLPIQMSNGL